MKNTIVEIRNATALVAELQNPLTNAQCAVDAHESGCDESNEEMHGAFHTMRDQFLVELAHQDGDALAVYLIQHSVAKGLALEVLAEFTRIQREVR